MRQLFRDNWPYILVGFLIWLTASFFIFEKRHSIYSAITLYFFEPGYDRMRMQSFLSEGDEILGKNNVNLQLMSEICGFYRSKDNLDDIFYEPTWREKCRWVGEELGIASGCGSLDEEPKSTDQSRIFEEKEKSQVDSLREKEKMRQKSMDEFSAQDYWDEKVDYVLEAMDYYKRALNYSGPRIDAARRIELAARASCRPQEITVAYSTYIRDAEIYVSRHPASPNAECKLTDDLSLSSDALDTNRKVWRQIRCASDPEYPDPNEFVEGLHSLYILALDPGLSLEEQIELTNRLLYFGNNNFDPEHKWSSRPHLLGERGVLFYQMARRDPKYYSKSIQSFLEAAKMAGNKRSSENSIATSKFVFKAYIWMARVRLDQRKPSLALQLLEKVESELPVVDGRNTGVVDLSLLKEYNSLKKEGLRSLGKYEEADAIQ